jgi:4-diphosphocytidyl-2-C-methyl-D-erythritol kinase
LRKQADKIWLAPAKLNLMLKVLSRRPNGYHELQTVFQILDYGDDMWFRESVSGEIERDCGDFEKVVPFDDDICVKAVKALEQHSAKKLPVCIGIEKRLPLGGGIGGGSSNAATTLMVVNHQWQLGFSRKELQEIGLNLGADVPVFIFGQSVWAEGVGEKFTPINLDQQCYIVATPNVSVSTQAIFQHKDVFKRLTNPQVAIKIRDFLSGSKDNDLESVVRKEYPLVEKTFQWLEKYSNEYSSPQMSGTGASVFLPIASKQDGEEMITEAPDFLSCFVASGVQRHPIDDGVWPSG